MSVGSNSRRRPDERSGVVVPGFQWYSMQPPPARVPSREIANVRPSYQPRSVNRASSKVSPKSTPVALSVDSAATGLMFAVESKAAAQNAAVRVIRRLRVNVDDS